MGAVTDALRRSLKLGRGKQASAKTLIESFRYPRRGPGMMWEAAAAKIAARGGRIAHDRSLSALSWDAGSRLWTASFETAAGARHSVTARHVVSSAAIHDLVGALKPAPLSTFNARALRYRDFLTVALIARTARDFPDNWVYIHDPAVHVGRVQNFRSWSDRKSVV